MVSMAGTETRREAGTLSVADAERLAEIMQALASPVRLRILSALSVQPSTVTDLSEQLHIGQTTTSNHLRLLRHLSLVLGTRALRRPRLRTARGGHRAPRASARRRMTPAGAPRLTRVFPFTSGGAAAAGESASLPVRTRCMVCSRSPRRP